MTLTVQNLITAAAAFTALGVLLASYNKGYDFVRRQKKQAEEIRAIREEQQLLTRGVLACLKGLKEQGCNGPVSEAIVQLESHLIGLIK